ncbi:GNAT family N-acetyltransferase [Paenibacillus solisilvae]|uniref:GNAT family N-acetyltransferase n=1 Tax=Paenibacillus solisilvae TaxID=2486751 RepID=A0ABW0W2Z3_9BACL
MQSLCGINAYSSPERLLSRLFAQQITLIGLLLSSGTSLRYIVLKRSGYPNEIDYATELDFDYIAKQDHHIMSDLIGRKITEKEIAIIRDQEGIYLGFMRFGYFWDNTPFMNMIWMDERCRGKGIGTKVVLWWENEMKEKGCKRVMTSTLASEEAQHFYRKLGYLDAGCLLLDHEPLEILMTKSI